MSDQEEQFAAMSQTRGFMLTRQAAIHLGGWVLIFSLFAATDSWAQLTGWSLAAVLNMLTGIVAGFLSINLAHEWFHYLGARLVSGQYTITNKPSAFVFDWQFDKNSLSQFYFMSIAGSVGGALALMGLFNAIETNNLGRVSLLSGAFASFAFAAIVEWPVLWRTRHSRNPLAELSKLSPAKLGRAAAGSALAGLLCWMTLT
jgi:hypothetical protein